MRVALDQLARLRQDGSPRGVTSVCSAHPVVLRAALRHGTKTGATVLIEATCNQVNHQGGYTGITPRDFVALVETIAREEGCSPDQIVLGGDHLGPNPWRDRPAAEAMAEAGKMVEAYVAAGFRKIHLDASMGCAGEPATLDDERNAERAVHLAAIAEETARRTGGAMPQYIIGTEVPAPGGADHALDAIEPTAPEAALRTVAVHREIFNKAQLSAAFERVIGVVVQPGVEFGNHNVITYQRDKARALIQTLGDEPGLVFEAHSTDYQGEPALTELVEDGFAILKVGPELTFVLREALYALDLIASDLLPDYGDRPLYRTMEALMVAKPEHWSRHSHGTSAEQRLLRHYSLSDRIRYYWAAPEAQAAAERLMTALADARVPRSLIWQHLPGADEFSEIPLDPQQILIWRVEKSLSTYHRACRV